MYVSLMAWLLIIYILALPSEKGNIFLSITSIICTCFFITPNVPCHTLLQFKLCSRIALPQIYCLTLLSSNISVSFCQAFLPVCILSKPLCYNACQGSWNALPNLSIFPSFASPFPQYNVELLDSLTNH